MNFFDELKRRNVFRVGFAYAVVGWLVAQVAQLALESFGAPDWVMKTLLFFIVIGFVIALFVAWAYELTPEGIKRAEDVDPNHSITHQTSRKLDRMVIFALVLALGYFAYDKFARAPATGQGSIAEPVITASDSDPDQQSELSSGNAAGVSAETPPTSQAPSVAVLPFVNMSSDPEQEFFSDGISEEILNVLTRIPNLKVAARTSSFQFKGRNLDIEKIGEQLNVNHVLEGSVRKSGTTLRITAQLIATDNGFHLWSKTFDRKLDDVFAIQDEIAAAIAHELRTRLGRELDTPSTPVDLQAYELYLKGRSLAAKRGEQNLLGAIEVLKDAIDIGPGYAPAMAMLAKAYAVLPWFSVKIPAGEARKLARQWADKALVLDPDNVEALAVMAIVYNEVDINPAGALKLLKRAVTINPGSIAANNFLGDIYTRIGDFRNALTYESRAAELDPLAPVHLTDLANVYLMEGAYNKVIELANRALTLDPAFPHALVHLADASYALGDTAMLADVYQRMSAVPALGETWPVTAGMELDIARGDTDKARADLEVQIERAKAGKLSAVDVASNAVVLGDYDAAGDLLALAHRNGNNLWVFPLWVRLPEQAPDSEPWQSFWRQPALQELVDLRRKNGLDPHVPGFGEGAKK